jgi:hypothetical protein
MSFPYLIFQRGLADEEELPPSHKPSECSPSGSIDPQELELHPNPQPSPDTWQIPGPPPPPPTRELVHKPPVIDTGQTGDRSATARRRPHAPHASPYTRWPLEMHERPSERVVHVNEPLAPSTSSRYGRPHAMLPSTSEPISVRTHQNTGSSTSSTAASFTIGELDNIDDSTIEAKLINGGYSVCSISQDGVVKAYK